MRWMILSGWLAVCGLAQDHQVPKHWIGAGTLTAASARPPGEISRAFLSAFLGEQGFSPADLAGAYVAREYSDAHNGVTHVLYRQQFRGLEVYNAAFVVNLDAQGRVLNAGGDLFIEPGLPPPEQPSVLAAVRAAVRAVNPGIAYQPFLSSRPSKRPGGVRFAQAGLRSEVEGRPVWYALRRQLLPAWVFVVAESDSGANYAVVVESTTGEVLVREALTFYQNPPRGLVFERGSPQPNAKPGTLVIEAPGVAQRSIQPLVGDPVASPEGWVKNGETAGNNAIVAENLLGAIPPASVAPTKAVDGDFVFPLELGGGSPNPLRFPDAANANLFYWVNRAHDLFYVSGFTEAAGNFQQLNFGRGGVGGDPLRAFSHFGAQAQGSARRVNAFFTASDTTDGSDSYVAMFVGDGGAGSFFTDGALDAGVIVHEYTHGVSLRLLPRGYDTFQAAAMGEGWSDYFSLEFTLPEGAPPDGRYGIGEYFFQTWGQSIRSRPYTTNLEENPLSFGQLGRVRPYQQVHADGEIWCLALWEARANLIRQFGEREGRRRINLLILDGMKLAPPSATMLDMRDAILLADRVNFDGASQGELWAAFAKRGMGALAYSGNPDITYVNPSFELPSDRGKVTFSTEVAVIGEPVQVIVSDGNYSEKTARVTLTSSSGDVETIHARRAGSIYTAPIFTSSGLVGIRNGRLELMHGDYISAYYDDHSAEGQFAQIQATIPTQSPYWVSSSQSAFEFPDERRVTPTDSGVRVDLPWEFPFFNQKHRYFFVHGNGLLTFGSTYRLSGLGPCTDRATFQAVPGIAPMFVNLTVFGNAQPGEGVFVTRGIGDSITVRWAGETVTPFGSSMRGSAVNFAATLHRDGRIEFRYGKGNTELGSALTPSSCGPGPVVGLSPGRDSYVMQVLMPAFTEGTTLKFDPPFGASSIPAAKIESPRTGDAVKDILRVTGVAYDKASAISRVDVLVGGVKLASPSVSLSRPDYCAKENVPGCPRVGWSAVINTAGLEPGEHEVRIRVTNSRGGFADFPERPVTIRIEPGTSHRPFGQLESPAPGSTVSGQLKVTGYAGAVDLRVVSVDTLIDGVTYGPTSYGLRRDDACRSLDPVPSGCPAIGYQLILNTQSAVPPLSDGEHRIQVRVRDEAGRFTLIPEEPVTFRINNGERGSVMGAVTTLKPGDTLSGAVEISGYAYVPGGAIRSVALYVDEVLDFGSVPYGLPRPDICEGRPDITACPGIGFSTIFDTSRLANGPHTLSVMVLTNTGESVRIPLRGTPVLNVIVTN